MTSVMQSEQSGSLNRFAPSSGISTWDVGPRDFQSGEFGRRVTQRRIELDLTIEELALRAEIDPEYLRYFEANPEAALSAGARLLLLLALDTTRPSVAVN
ncbi:MAG TPA: hypothetical protein VGL48_13450 [Acidimicrobiales bacterium]